MPDYSLKQLWRASPGWRRRRVVLRPITISPVLAGDLYAASYKPVIESWRDALPAIEAAYERRLRDLTTDSEGDHPESTLAETAARIAALAITIRAGLRRWGELVERHQRQKWVTTIRASITIEVGGMVRAADVSPAIEAAVARNVELVSSVSAEARERIAAEVIDGYKNRRPARAVAKALAESLDITRRRALNIASDQSSKLGAELNIERARQAGLTHYQWMSSHKAHARPEHAARDGEIFAYGTPAGDEPGMAIHCGCCARSVLGDG